MASRGKPWIVCAAIPYVEEAIQAEQRLRAGHRQVYCGDCGRWRWPEECGHSGRLTPAEFRAMERAVKRAYPVRSPR